MSLERTHKSHSPDEILQEVKQKTSAITIEAQELELALSRATNQKTIEDIKQQAFEMFKAHVFSVGKLIVAITSAGLVVGYQFAQEAWNAVNEMNMSILRFQEGLFKMTMAPRAKLMSIKSIAPRQAVDYFPSSDSFLEFIKSASTYMGFDQTQIKDVMDYAVEKNMSFDDMIHEIAKLAGSITHPHTYLFTSYKQVFYCAFLLLLGISLFTVVFGKDSINARFLWKIMNKSNDAIRQIQPPPEIIEPVQKTGTSPQPKQQVEEIDKDPEPAQPAQPPSQLKKKPRRRVIEVVQHEDTDEG
jgi:hypothetical protein